MTSILSYIGERSPRGAQSVRTELQAAVERLADHPFSGRSTGKGDMRCVVANPYPYLIFYRVTVAGVTIHRVRHAARR
jgi:plasmid stabilization system protein ParE